ncbi:putative nonribosomal peptide synthetase [Lentinula detonsa]|uniref:Nonribosomal peptide synthetase n=1 Tax=Lentinula detonsa TaxID=2804962 RepID=A0A9W8NZ36_9AGAR|nr:putative nonribosomal peptide synthetase [Lentinula detonsa]
MAQESSTVNDRVRFDWRPSIVKAGIDPNHVEDVYFATPFQQGVLHTTTKSRPPGRFLIAFHTFILPPHADVSRLCAAWDILVGSASILRTGFCVSPNGVLAIVYKADASKPREIKWVEDVRNDLDQNGIQASKLNFVQNLAFDSYSGHVPLGVHVVGNPRIGYHVQFALHHSLFDGASMVILMKALNTLYREGFGGTNARLSIPSFAAVADAIHMQRIPAMNTAAEYWRRFCNNLPNATWPYSSLISSHNDSPFCMETLFLYCAVPKQSRPNLPAFRSRTARAALAIAVMLHSNLNDIIFSETRSSRSLLPVHLQSAPGPCLAAQLVRLQCNPSTTLVDLLDEAGNTETERIAKECPMTFGQIMEAAGSTVSKKIRAFLTMHSATFRLTDEHVPGWKFMGSASYHETPLNINIFPPQNGACEIRLRYDSAISQHIDVPAFFDHFVSILGILGSLDHKSPASVDFVSVNDILKRLGAIDAPLTRHFGLGPQNIVEDCIQKSFPNVHEVFQENARSNPSAIALDFEASYTMTYGELDARSTVLAFELRQRGVGRDVMVPLLFDSSVEMIIAILGVMKAGGAYGNYILLFPLDSSAYVICCTVPLGVDHPRARLERVLSLTNAKLLLYGSGKHTVRITDLEETFPGLQVALVALDQNLVITDISSDVLPSVDGSHLAYVLFTSGSTGGVGVEHHNLSALFRSGQADAATHPGMRKLLLSPYTFDISVGDIFSALTTGNMLVLVRRERMLSNLLFWLEKTCTTHLSITSTLARHLPTDGIPFLKYINFVGETVPIDVASRLSRTRNLRNTMGPTECVVSATEYIIPPHSTTASFGERVPIGRPIGSTNIYILRPSTYDLVAIGEVGEICIGGSQVSRGYVTDAALSEAKFVSDPFSNVAGARMFRSGDLGRWNRNKLLEHLGRMDRQIKLRGLRVETGEIETVVQNASEDISSVYVDMHEVEGEQVLIALMVLALDEAVEESDSRTVHVLDATRESVKVAVKKGKEACEKLLPVYMKPAVWHCISSLPRDSNGKLDHRVLQDLIRGLFKVTSSVKTNGINHKSPRIAASENEHTIISVLSQILARSPESIDLDTSFLALGGTSLQAMRVTSLLQMHGIDVSISDCLDDCKTIAMIASQAPGHIDDHTTLLNDHRQNLKSKLYTQFCMAPTGWEEAINSFGLKVEDIEDVYPRTTAALDWVELALQHEGRSVISQYTHDLGVDIDPVRFERAWEQLCFIEPSLRTIFVRLQSSSESTKGNLTSVVLKGTAECVRHRGAVFELQRLADNDSVLNEESIILKEHHVELGIVPIRAWLLLDENNGKWSFVTSRHHVLHDVRTLGFQADALNLLYHQGPSALPTLSAKWELANSYGAWMYSQISGNEHEKFWRHYLERAQPSIWPEPKYVKVGYSKDLSNFQFCFGKWEGSVADIAKKLGVTKGAVLRGAWAVAIAEQQSRVRGLKKGEEPEELVTVFEPVEGRQGTTAWGFLNHMGITVVRVPASSPGEGDRELNRLVQTVKNAHTSFAEMLPWISTAHDYAQQILGPKVEAGHMFQTTILNILDMTHGDLRKDKKKKNVQATTQASLEGSQQLFDNSLLRSTLVGVYLPGGIELNVMSDSIAFISPYDTEVMRMEEVERFVQVQVEVLAKLGA